jgi:pimeloyl-ACP methyl ester carboxylesterase
MRLAASLLVLLAAFVALTLWRAAGNDRAATEAFPPEGQFVTDEGYRMHAVVAGAGPDLVLIHGSSGSTRDFTHSLLPRLAERYRVIAIDRPGFGWSEPVPDGETLSVQARFLRETASALGAVRPIVVGHSYGGTVALAWAVEAPDSLAALVTLSTPSHVWEGGLPLYYRLTTPPVLGRLARAAISAWATDAMIRAGTEAVFAPDPMPLGYVAHFGPRLSLREGTASLNGRQRAILKDEIRALSPRYSAIRVPLEQVHGTADVTVGLSIHAEPLTAAVAGANLTRLPGIGHMPHQVSPDDVVAAIDRAAARVPAAP